MIDGNQGIAAAMHKDGRFAVEFGARLHFGHAGAHARALRGQRAAQAGAIDGIQSRRQAAQAQEAVERLVRQVV